MKAFLAVAAFIVGAVVEHVRPFGTRWQQRNAADLLARSACWGHCDTWTATIESATRIDEAA